MKIMIINGPNINLLGIREPDIYGNSTYDDMVSFIRDMRGEDSDAGHELCFFQSNHEGAIIDEIQYAYREGFDGIVINAAGYTHTSIAIMDALKAVQIPTVEVHLSDPSLREDYRHHSYISEVAVATLAGDHFNGYIDAIDILSEQR